MQMSKWRMSKLLLVRKLALAAGIAALSGMVLSSTGLYQTAVAASMPKRVHGTIDKVDNGVMEVTTRGGDKMTFKLAATTSVVGITKATASDIKSGTFIGTAAMPQPDGTLKAMEVHIFPASMNGTGEGERPWDQGKNSTMTNGMVGDVVGNDGHSFTVKFDGKERKVMVPDNAPVVMMVPADQTLLTTGAKVIVFADPKDPKTAARIAVGENGVTPPM
jgi:hypothetical protein